MRMGGTDLNVGRAALLCGMLGAAALLFYVQSPVVVDGAGGNGQNNLRVAIFFVA